jgi:PAS domain S-box-containing protein
MKNKRIFLERLRDNAETVLKKSSKPGVYIGTGKKIEQILHELQVYQVELEMQNDELIMAQVALEAEKQKFAGLFNLAPVSYLILDGTARISQCNEAALSLFAVSRAKITEKRFQGFVFADDLPLFYKFLSKLVFAKEKQNCELRMRTGEGSIMHMYLEGVSLFSVSEEAKFYIAAFDLTARKQAEDKQAELSERLKMALSASSMGSLKLCLNTGQLDIDEHALQILQISQPYNGAYAALLGLIHPDDRNSTDLAIRSAVSTDNQVSIGFRIQNKNEIKFIELKGEAKELTNETFFIGMISDVTAAREADRIAKENKVTEHNQRVREIITAQENERVRISGSLHDGLGQLLYAVQMCLQQLNDKPSSDMTLKAQNLVVEAIRETRNISFQLAPSILADYGLKVALPEMLARISGPGLVITHKITGLEKRLSSDGETMIFRVAQELFNNIIKHAHASRASLLLSLEDGELLMKVSDNGAGFLIEADVPKGTGLVSINNRIKLYDGQMKIRSPKRGGTEIVIKVPSFK